MATPGSSCEIRVHDPHAGTHTGVAGKVSSDGSTCRPTQTLMGWLTPLNNGVRCGTSITIPGPSGSMTAEALCPH
jgi:hypothetical protein